MNAKTRKILLAAREKCTELFDIRHHLPAYVLVSIFSSVALVSVILICIYSATAMDDLSQGTRQNGQNAVDTISAQLESYSNTLSMTHTLLFSSKEIRTYLEGKQEEIPSYTWFQMYNDALEMLKLCASSQYSLISGIALEKGNQESLKCGAFDQPFHLFEFAPGQRNRLLFYHDSIICVSFLSTGNGSAWLLSQMYNSVVDDLCRGLLIPGSVLLLEDESGSVVRYYAADSAGEKQYEAWMTGATSKLEKIWNASPVTRLKTIMILPNTTFWEKLMTVLPFLGPILLLTLGLGFLLSYGLSRKVKRSFETMERNVQMVENQEQERAAHELELQVLRAQISPHFLSNALNSVRSLTSMQGMNHIERLITAIMRLLRASLSSPDTMVTLAQEIEYVRNYIEICQYQYLNDIDLEIEMDDALRNCVMPPMVLQPLVENSVIHGIADFQNEGRIRIRAIQEGNNLVLSVTDNGQGMTEEQLGTLLNQPRNVNHRRFSGIGLQNVNRRIQMRYGEKYGLKIISKPQEYTVVQIALPLVYEEVRDETDSARG